MRTGPPLLVELMGQPGAGKSTLARAAAAGSDLLTRADLGAAWQGLSIRRKGSFVRQAVLDVACLTHAGKLAIRAPLLHGGSLFRLANLVAKSHWIRSQSGPLLLSEGCLQDLWSIFYSAGKLEPDPPMLAPLIRCLYRGVSARIVLLDADPQTAFGRIRGRANGRSRFDRLEEADLHPRLLETAQLPLRIAEGARLAGLAVETLDVSQPLEASVTRLRAILTKPDAGADRQGAVRA